MSDKKEDKKADKKGGDKPKADKKGGDKPKADKKADDKKGGDKKEKAAAPAGDDKKADKAAAKKDDGKAAPAPAPAAAADAAPAAAAGGDDKKQGKKDKKNKGKDGDKKDGAAAADGDAKKEDGAVVELTHFDPNAPVPQPDKAKLESDKKTLEKVIKELEGQITKLSATIEAKSAERNKLRAAKNELFEKGKGMKEQRELKDTEVRKLTTKIDEIIAERKNNRQRLDATKSALRFTKSEDLEKAISQTELRIGTSTLSLADEKKLIAELKLMKSQRAEVAAFADAEKKVKHENDAKAADLKAGDVRSKRDALRKEAHAMFTEERKVFDEFRVKKDADNELKREIDVLVAKRKTCLDDKRKFLDSLYSMQREFVKAERAFFKFQQQQRALKQSQNRTAYRNAQRDAAEKASAPSDAPINMEHQKPHTATGPRPAAGQGNRKKREGRGAAGGDDDAPKKPKKPSVAGPDGDDESEPEDEIEDMSNFVPFAREKALCDKLVRYLQQLLAQKGVAKAEDKKDEAKSAEAKADEAKLVEERNSKFKGGKQPVVVMKKEKATMKLEDFFGKDVSKSNAPINKPKKASGAGLLELGAAKAGGDAKLVQPTDKKEAARLAAKKQKLTHVPDVFTDFKEISLAAPSEVGQIEQSIKDLIAKKAYYETNPDIEADQAAAEPAPTTEEEAAPAPAAAAEDVKAEDKKGKGKKKSKKADADAPVESDGAAADKAMDEEKAARVKEQNDLIEANKKTTAETRKKAAKAADAAADAEKARRVAEAAADKSAAAAEETTERKRRRSAAGEAEDAEQKRRVAEATKADAANAAEEQKVRATGRRNSLQAEDAEKVRRLAAGEDRHDKPSVLAQVDAAAHGKKAAAPAANDVKPAAADSKKAEKPAAKESGAAAAGASDLVAKVDADLQKSGYEPFTNSN